jgi:hypothetical protein
MGADMDEAIDSLLAMQPLCCLSRLAPKRRNLVAQR